MNTPPVNIMVKIHSTMKQTNLLIVLGLLGSTLHMNLIWNNHSVKYEINYVWLVDYRSLALWSKNKCIWHQKILSKNYITQCITLQHLTSFVQYKFGFVHRTHVQTFLIEWFCYAHSRTSPFTPVPLPIFHKKIS